MKHQPTSLLLNVLVIFACFMICGPLGNASSAPLEMPKEDNVYGFVASTGIQPCDPLPCRGCEDCEPSKGLLSARSLLTGTVAMTPTRVTTPTTTSTATSSKAPTPTTPAATGTKSSTPTNTKPSPTNTPPSVSPTRTATRTGTAAATRTPMPELTRTLTFSTTPAVSVTVVMTRPPTVTRTPTLTRTRTLTPTATLTPTLTLTPTATLTRTATITPAVRAAAQITTALGAEIDIDPVLGGQLNIGNGAFIIQMPAGAFTTTQRLVFERLKPDRERDGSVQLMLAAFSLRAVNQTTGIETTQFAKAATIQVRYDAKWVQGWRDRDLTLAYWDAKRKQWTPLASSVDITRRTVTAQTTHFTDYGLIAGPNIQPYLPNVQSAEPNLFLGAATASYDLQVPPGRSGLAPKLALSYSSAGVDMMDQYQSPSFVGTGWSFSTSYIARDIRSNIVTDDDVFSLVMNGSGYDLVKGTDGYYHTSQEQYWRISFDTTNNRWLVLTNDGTQYQYGYSDNSRAIERLRDADPAHDYLWTTYAYWLERVIDTHGNEIKYTYQHDVGTVDCYSTGSKTFDNGLYPQTIEYNGAGTTFLTRIEFTYSSRNDVRHMGTTYQCAVPVQTLKLDRIDVKTTDNASTLQLVRRYEFGYDPAYPLFPGYWTDVFSPGGQRYFGRLTLNTITQKGSDGSSVLSTFTANYADNRLSSVDNGIGGVVSFGYASAYWFNELYSPVTVWGWDWSGLEAGTITPWPDNGAAKLAGDGYAVLRAPSFIPGANYRVLASVERSYDSSCTMQMRLWDGVRETAVTGWINPLLGSEGGSSLDGGFLLGHDATAAEIRIYVSASNGCRFWYATGTLYRTYYRVASRTISDGVANWAATTYAYEGPQLNYTNISAAAASPNPRVPRYTQFRGHSKVTATDPTGAKQEYYFKQDDVLLGRVWQTYQKDAGGATFTRTENQHEQRTIGVVQQCAAPQCENPVTGDVSNYVYTSAALRDTYDGQPTPKSVRTVYTPDAYGNIVQTDEYSETGALYRTTQQTFYPNTAAWILNKVGLSQVLAGGTTRVGETRRFYDGATSYTTPPTKGDLTRVDGTTDGTNFFTQWTTGYDSYGNPTRITDALGHATTTVYDSRYRMFPISVTGPAPFNFVTTNTYETRMGKLLTTTDPNNATTTYTYDVYGRTTAIWAPLDRNYAATATYSYTLANPVSTVRVQVRQDAGGSAPADYQTSWWFYDGLGRVIQQQTSNRPGSVVIVDTLYDRRGQVQRVSNPYEYAPPSGGPPPPYPYRVYLPLIFRSNPSGPGNYVPPNWSQPFTEHQYDAIGRATLTTYPDHTTLTTSYLQWTTTVTDAKQHRKKTVADAFGRTVQVIEYGEPPYGEAYTTTYAYDVLDRLGVVTNSATPPRAISMVYDWLGRKTTLVDPDLGTWYYAYDDAGNLLLQTDAKHQATCSYYDALNRATGRGHTTTVGEPNPSPAAYCTGAAQVTFSYDQGTNAIGRRSVLSTPGAGTTAWAYDLQGRTISETVSLDGAPAAYTTQWLYDAQDRPRRMTYPTGEVLNATYNLLGLPQTLSPYVASSEYNAARELTHLVYGNGAVTDRAYFSDNLRLQSLVTTLNGDLQRLTYGYDAVGNVTSLADGVRNETATFTYDAFDRLTTASIPSVYTQEWTYNSIGNITQRKDNGVPVSYSYEDLNQVHAVTHVGTQAYAYDPNGNLTHRAGDTLAYDAENRLVQVTSSDGVTTTVYVYNGDGQRVKKSVTANGATTTTFYVGNWFEVTEGVATSYYYFGGQRVAMKRGTTVTYLYGDHLGSTSVTADASGTQTARQTYYAYGTARTAEGTLPTDYTFTGQKLDSYINLLQMGARWYDPNLGRFVQPDSIIPDPFNPQSLNRYSYALNNPVRFTDPSGHGTLEDLWAALQRLWRMLSDPRYARSQACGLSVDPICGRAAADAPGSPSVGGVLESVNRSVVQANRFSLGPGLSPETLRTIEMMGGVIDRVAALNHIFGAPPHERVESTYEYKTSSRQEQLDMFASSYFPDLKDRADVVYGGNLGEAKYGRFCAAGEDCGGIVYDRDTVVIGEAAFAKGGTEVGVTIFHEQLEQLKAEGEELTHEDIDRYEDLWREWYDQ